MIKYERMINVKVKDIMTKNVAYISPTSTVADAAKMMQQHNVGSIPVCDQNGLVGIVTDRDIVVRNIARKPSEYCNKGCNDASG